MRRDTRVWSLTYGAQATPSVLLGEPAPPGTLLPLSFWVVRVGSSAILVDCGANPEWAMKKSVIEYQPMETMLARIGVSVTDVDILILTHLHWDHAGNAERFHGARIVVQQAELDGWSYMLADPATYSWAYEQRIDPSQIALLRNSPNVDVVSGVAEIAPGVTVHPGPGHTAGLQYVKVELGDHPIVLTSDAVFSRENLVRMVPNSNTLNVVETLATFSAVKAAARERGLIVPGHDQTFLSELPSSSPGVRDLTSVLS